jgi:UDP-N-acetylmuramoylalanine--D-glutamate ligase
VEPIYRGKSVVILGLARQGMALARYLAQAGARVTVSDRQTEGTLAASLAALNDLTIEYVLGDHPLTLLERADLLCLSGGVPADLPIVIEARRRGVPLSNDSQVFLEVCPPGVTVVGLTGSAGKTTTTTLVGRILTAKDEGRFARMRAERKHELHPAKQSFIPPPSTVWVGGNIGNPLIADVGQMRPGDLVVMELSSFQLELMTRSPHVAAVLNLTPNHLDRHGTLEAYAAAKSNILRYQAPDDVAVLGWDDVGSRRLASLVRGRLAIFSGEGEVERGAFLRARRGSPAGGEEVVWRWEGREQVVCLTGDIRLRGRHNLLNVLAACAISGAAGATLEMMRAGIAGFKGIEHRLELVRERDGVRWYNDSIATAPERVVAALKSFDEPVVLLAGGRDKKLPWDEFARLVKERVKYVVLFGEAAPLIQTALEAVDMDAVRYTRCATLAEAVRAAAGRAQNGDVVLLSPGGTSYDEFKDFAERGEKFREWVKAL